jgi:glycosyltransferase involved in cell wall biosynthesis
MTERVRVLRVIARLNVGGPALHVSYLTRGLDERGYETTLVTGSIGPGEGSMAYVADELGVQPVYVPELQREISFGDERQATAAILRLLRRHRPHVLHTHTAKAGAVGRLAALLAGRDRPPVVVHTFHGHVLRGYFSPSRTAAFGAIERGLAHAADALIAVSPEVKDDLVRLGVAPAERIVVIRLGLDLAARTRAAPGAGAALRRELGIAPERFVVGWLGRMTDIKRIDHLLDGVARARSAGGELDVLLVGDGPLRADLEVRARELGLDGVVRFVGFREDVASVYAAVDAVALTSANEGTPVSVIEALAAGKPAVATDVGGVRDVVRDGDTGLLVPAGDVEALAARLGDLAGDAALRGRLGAAGRASVLSRYGVPRLLDDVDRLYRSLLEARDPARRRTFGPIGRPLPATAGGARPVRTTRPLRVLLLSQYFPPEVGATQSRLQAFAEHLAARGHDVTVVCEFPNHPHGVIPAAYRGRLVEDDRSNPYRVLRVWVRATTEKTQRTRVEFYLSYMTMAALVAPRVGRVDVVVATSPPLFTAVAGAAIARVMRAPLVLDVRDLWPAAAVSLGQLSHPVARRGSEAVERWLYREAAAVVAVTRPFCEHIDRVRRLPPRTAFVPNGTLDRFFDARPDGARERLGVGSDRHLATFAGNLGIAQALDTILGAAAVDPGTDYVFLGDGPIRDQLMAQATSKGLDNVRFHEQVPLDEVPPFLAASDALLVTLSAHPTFASFVPSKLVDFLATGRPVVLAAAGEAARILSRAGGGVVVAPEQPSALAAAVRSLRHDPVRARELGARGRAFARTRLRAVQSERLEALLHDVARR